MKRIMIIGPSGAGKSTLARQLGEIFNLPVHHLDTYFWKAGWIPTPNDEWDFFLEELIQNEKWIIDGNYSRTLDIRLKRADVIIFLDFSTWLTLYRVIKRRWMYHGKTRPDMNKDCQEKLDIEFLRWVWNFRKTQRPHILEKLKIREDKTIIILKSPKEVKRLIEKYKSTRSSLTMNV